MSGPSSSSPEPGRNEESQGVVDSQLGSSFAEIADPVQWFLTAIRFSGFRQPTAPKSGELREPNGVAARLPDVNLRAAIERLVSRLDYGRAGE